MKKRTFITAILAIMMAVTPALAQKENKRSRESHQTRLNGRVVTDEVEDNEFKKFNVRDDFTENGFQWFHNAELLAAGDKEDSNAMTIGWGDWNALGAYCLDCLCGRETLHQGVYRQGGILYRDGLRFKGQQGNELYGN